MRNRSRTHTPVSLGNQTRIEELMEIRGVVDWYTKIPLDTPLVRLVTIDPSVELIERDVTLLCVTAQSPKTVTLHAPRESERMAVPGSRQRPCRLRAHGIRSGRHAGEDRQ